MVNNDTFHKVMNAVLFQLVWVLAIFFSWQLALMALLGLLAHSCITYLNKEIMKPLLIVAGVGIMLDSIMMGVGLYQFDQTLLAGWLVPAWLCVLWFAFALTLPSSMSWMFSRPLIVVPVFAMLAPFSYLAGRKFDALYFEDITLLFIAVCWGVIGYLAFSLLKNSANGVRENELVCTVQSHS